VLYLGADLLTREKNRRLRTTERRIVDQELCGQETFVGAAGIKRKFSNFNTSCKKMSRYFTSEALAEERVRDHFRSTFWTKRSSVEEWDDRIADAEEQYESAKHHAASAMSQAEKTHDFAEHLSWEKDHGEMIEVC